MKPPEGEACGVIQIEIERRRPQETKSYRQIFAYEPQSDADTVATALNELNAREDLRDIGGQPAGEIRWECSCLQKKCGACAMRINGHPALACDMPLRGIRGRVVLEPLRKFPVVTDLIVDRTQMQENLRQMHVWFQEPAVLHEKTVNIGYEATRCLQCGLCLEVCPNFDPEGRFAGMAGAMPLTRLLAEMPESQKKESAKVYRDRVYGGCGKSLACHDVCPAEIPMDELLAQSAAAAVWNRWLTRGGIPFISESRTNR